MDNPYRNVMAWKGTIERLVRTPDAFDALSMAWVIQLVFGIWPASTRGCGGMRRGFVSTGCNGSHPYPSTQ